MGLWDVAKKGVSAVGDFGSSMVDKASDLYNSTYETVKSVGSGLVENTVDLYNTVTNIDITKTLKAVGTVITNPSTAIFQGIDYISSNYATGGKAVEVMSMTAAALSGPVGFAEVAAKLTMGNVKVEQVASLPQDQNNVEFGNIWEQYEKQQLAQSGNRPSTGNGRAQEQSTEPQVVQASAAGTVIEFTDPFRRPKADAPQAVTTGDAQAAQTNTRTENGITTDARVQAGQATVRQTDASGNVITEATSTADRARVTNSGVTAVLSRSTNELTVTHEQMQILQKDGDGRTIYKNKGGIRMYDRDGLFVQAIDLTKVRVCDQVTLVRDKAEMAAQAGRAVEQGLKTTQVWVTPDKEMLAAFEDGSMFQIRQDLSAIIRTTDKRILIIDPKKQGKVVEFANGAFKELDTDEVARAVGEHIRIDGTQINGRDLQIDLQQQMLKLFSQQSGGQATAEVNYGAGAGQGVRINTARTQVVAAGDNVTTTTQEGQPVSDYNFKTQELKTPEVTQNLRTNETTINATGTVVKENNEVDWGKNGPKLHADLSIQVDEKTFISANGEVTSGSWKASANFGGFVANPQAASAESAGRTTATTAAASAQSIYNKAQSGIVTMSDIGALNVGLGDVTAAISMLIAKGGDPSIIGELNRSYLKILDTINFALPKAQAAQIAQDKGVTSAFLLKQIEDGSYGNDPHKAAQKVLVAAA
jgi:hypothetical protein